MMESRPEEALKTTGGGDSLEQPMDPSGCPVNVFNDASQGSSGPRSHGASTGIAALIQNLWKQSLILA